MNVNPEYKLAAACIALALFAWPCSAAETLIISDTTESMTGGFKFPDGSVQTTAYTGGAGGGISLTSPDGSISVGGSPTAPTVRLNFSLIDQLYAPFSGSPNYVSKGGDTMSGLLTLPANGLQMAGNQIVTSGGSFGYGAAPKPGMLFAISGTYTTPAPTSYGAHLLQIDGTAKSSALGQAYLRGIYLAPTFDVTNGYANYLTGIETYMGYKTGGNVAHSVVGYHLSGQPASGLECSVGFGISVPNQQPSLCNGTYGFYQGDTAQYNYFASKVGIGTPFPTQPLTVQGNVQVNGDLNLTGKLMPSSGNIGFGAAPNSNAYFSISGTYATQAPASYGAHLLQIDGTAKSNVFGQAYLRGIYIAPTFDVTNGYANYLTGIETYMGNKLGSNVAHSVVGYHLSQEPTSGLECNVGFGIGVPNQQTGLCNGRYGFYQGDSSNVQYNYFASNVGIGTITPTQPLTVQGNAQISGNLTTGGSGAMPVYNNSGTALAAPHMVTGIVAVNGGGVVTLSGAAAFSSAGSYICTATMQSSSPSTVPVGVQNTSGSSFTLFSSTSGNANYICVGT